MALTGFVSEITKITASWLNSIDTLWVTVFGEAQTKAAARTALGVVNIAGDTMTGDLTISETASRLHLSGTQDAFIDFQDNGFNRWVVGSNSNADFEFNRYNASGVFQDLSISVSGTDGGVDLPNSLTVGANALTANFVQNGPAGATTVLDVQRGGASKWQLQDNGSGTGAVLTTPLTLSGGLTTGTTGTFITTTATNAILQHSSGSSLGIQTSSNDLALSAQGTSGIIYFRNNSDTEIGRLSTSGPDFVAATSNTPTVNGHITIEATNNTTLTFKLKGTDSVVRSGTITLS